MKTLFALAVLAAGLQAPQALAASIPDCYRAKDVVRGQFIVLLNEGLSQAQRVSISMALGELDLSVVNAIGTDTLLVERTALSQATRKEELATLAGLAKLLGQGVEVIECNGLARAL